MLHAPRRRAAVAACIVRGGADERDLGALCRRAGSSRPDVRAVQSGHFAGTPRDDGAAGSLRAGPATRSRRPRAAEDGGGAEAGGETGARTATARSGRAREAVAG